MIAIVVVVKHPAIYTCELSKYAKNKHTIYITSGMFICLPVVKLGAVTRAKVRDNSFLECFFLYKT